MNSLPDLGGGGAVGNLHLDIPGDRREQIIEDLLVFCNPCVVVGVGDELVQLLNRLGDLLRRHARLVGIEEVRHLRTAKSRPNLRPP